MFGSSLNGERNSVAVVIQTIILAAIAAMWVAITSPASAATPGQSASPATSTQVPAEKQTTLGLYVTAREAYDQWQAAPDKVTILDVRTIEEYMWVGHTSMAWLVPVVAVDYTWDAGKKQFPLKPLPDFVARVQKVAKPDDTLMVMCRSGGRGAMAVNLLAEGWIQERLQHHRRHGRRHGHGPRKRVPGPAPGEWLEECGPAVDL